MSFKHRRLNYLVLVTLLLIGLCGCEGNKIELDNSNHINTQADDKIIDGIDSLTEIDSKTQFGYNDIRWNDSLSLQLDCRFLSSTFSKIHIEVKPADKDMLECDSILYVHKSVFQKCNSNDCRLLRIVFDDSITEVSIGKKTLSINTTISELKHLFKTCSTLYERNIYEDKGHYRTCLIMSEYEDFGLYVFVKDDKIVHIDMYEPS